MTPPPPPTPSTVLVTGANGRLGRAVSARLRAAPGIDSRLYGGLSTSRNDEVVPLDLADRDALRTVVRSVRPDVIVHLASILGAKCDEDEAGAEAVNVDATRAIAEAAVEAGTARIVFASSAAVYGDARTEQLSEDAAPDAHSTYAKHKLRGERILEDAVAGSGRDARALSAVALRIFNVYGPGFDGSLVNRLRASAADSPVELVAMDEFVRDYVHVDDVVEAVFASLDATLPSGFEAINVGSGLGVSTRRLVQALERDAPVHYRESPGRPSSSVADIQRARTLLGFEPSDRLGAR